MSVDSELARVWRERLRTYAAKKQKAAELQHGDSEDRRYGDELWGECLAFEYEVAGKMAERSAMKEKMLVYRRLTDGSRWDLTDSPKSLIATLHRLNETGPSSIEGTSDE